MSRQGGRGGIRCTLCLGQFCEGPGLPHLSEREAIFVQRLVRRLGGVHRGRHTDEAPPPARRATARQGQATARQGQATARQGQATAAGVG